jgi:hypothetical protein
MPQLVCVPDQPARSIEPATSGHLGIEKKHIDSPFFERSNDFSSVVTLPSDFDLFTAGQKKSSARGPGVRHRQRGSSVSSSVAFVGDRNRDLKTSRGERLRFHCKLVFIKMCEPLPRVSESDAMPTLREPARDSSRVAHPQV